MQNYAELYFVAAMMILILIGCAVAVYAFFRTYNREKAQRELEKQAVERNKSKAETQTTE